MLPDENVITSMKEGYKYLGVLESNKILEEDMKMKISNEY